VRLIRVVVAASAVPLALAAGACTNVAPPVDTTPIVIGADLELSGVNAAVGSTYARALQLRVDQLNAAGGVDGRRVILDTKDNRSDPSLSLANVTAFAAEAGIAGIIVGSCTQCGSNIAQTVEAKHLPTVTLAPVSGGTRSTTDHRYLFRLGPSIDDGATVLTGLLRNDGIRTVALLSTNDVNGAAAATAFAGLAPRAGVTVVSKPTFQATDTDVSQPVQAALAKNPAALVVSAFPGQAALVTKSAHDAGYTGRLFFDATAAGDLFIARDLATATERAVMAAPQALVIDDVVATTPAKTSRKRWFDDYTSKYGAFSGYSTYPADAVKLLVDAVHTAGGPLRDRMRDAMENTVFDGLSGPVRFTPDNHSRQTSQGLSVVVARSGRWRLLG
jgi:branched-chain amino acid transport system substrate-binding protein